MGDLMIIAQREYWQRVRTKGFLIATFLGPFLLVISTLIIAFLAVQFGEESEKSITLVDETGVLGQKLSLPGEFDVTISDEPRDTVRAQLDRGEIDGYLVLPEELVNGEGEALYYSRGAGGISLSFELRSAVNQTIRNHRILASGAPDTVFAILQSSVPTRMIKVTDEGESADSTLALTGIGYGMAFLIYLCMILYGAIVMRGVIEEKTSRISELIASSATPFDLMLGKVLGIGAMGLTQFVLWSLIGFAMSLFAGGIALMFVDTAALDLPAEASQQAMLDAAGISIPEISPAIFLYFILFFLGGYLLYASLMAAVGSAVEQESDAQQFMWPVLIPLMIPMFFISQVAVAPDSALSVVLSIIPFSSPILMIVRIASTTVPFWQIGLSFLLLIIAFIGAVWLASRIYRIGILMYGKKPKLADLIKWIRVA